MPLSIRKAPQEAFLYRSRTRLRRVWDTTQTASLYLSFSLFLSVITQRTHARFFCAHSTRRPIARFASCLRPASRPQFEEISTRVTVFQCSAEYRAPSLSSPSPRRRPSRLIHLCSSPLRVSCSSKVPRTPSIKFRRSDTHLHPHHDALPQSSTSRFDLTFK